MDQTKRTSVDRYPSTVKCKFFLPTMSVPHLKRLSSGPGILVFFMNEADDGHGHRNLKSILLGIPGITSVGCVNFLFPIAFILDQHQDKVGKLDEVIGRVELEQDKSRWQRMW